MTNRHRGFPDLIGKRITSDDQNNRTSWSETLGRSAGKASQTANRTTCWEANSNGTKVIWSRPAPKKSRCTWHRPGLNRNVLGRFSWRNARPTVVQDLLWNQWGASWGAFCQVGAGFRLWVCLPSLPKIGHSASLHRTLGPKRKHRI